MCQTLKIRISPFGDLATIRPVDCHGTGALCRRVSQPYIDAIGVVVADDDITGEGNGHLSHVAVMELRVRDLDALDDAVRMLGMELHRGQETYRWYGTWVNDYHAKNAAFREFDHRTFGHCAHAITIPGHPTAYEIGVVPALDGDGYSLLWDNFDPGGMLTNRIGGDGERLLCAYIEAAAMRTRTAVGDMFQSRMVADDGTVELRFAAAERPAYA